MALFWGDLQHVAGLLRDNASSLQVLGVAGSTAVLLFRLAAANF